MIDCGCGLALSPFPGAVVSGSMSLGYIGPGAGLAAGGPVIGLLLAVLLAIAAPIAWPVYRFCRRRACRPGALLDRRLVVLGFDGMDYHCARAMIDAGQLPNLARLEASGGFGPLESTMPPVSPVAWSSFATGASPGRHGIFDFVRYSRSVGGLRLSSVSDSATDGRTAGAPPRNLQRGEPFWHCLGMHGVACTVLRVPLTYPPKPYRGNILSAMHVPDIRGTEGTYTVLSDTLECEAGTDTRAGEFVRLQRHGKGFEGWMPGPCDSRGQRMTSRVRIRVVDAGTARIRIGRTVHMLERGKFSAWVTVSFRSGRRRITGICRLLVLELVPRVRIYATPVNISPRHPAMPVSHPSWFSVCLAAGCGPFATLGIPEDAKAVRDGVLSEAGYAQLCGIIHDERRRMLLRCLSRQQTGLILCVFDLTDRVSHLFWPSSGPPSERGMIADAYRACDAVIGEVLAACRGGGGRSPGLVVLSDHGFCVFRRAVSLNAWLRDAGYLVRLETKGEASELAAIDWSRTTAYSFGFAGIYLHRPVAGDRAEAIKAAIVAGLEALEDPETGARAVTRVSDTSARYEGPYIGDGPDLVVGFNAGYRCAWASASGRCDGPVFSANTDVWKGDHAVDPSHVPGVLAVSDPALGAVSGGLHISQVASRILAYFGVDTPDGMVRVRADGEAE